ncbi:hypothetical protein M0804_013798 [Polistes exclamans]|nr:hypothetical protein M0804_013798 [Polistes exclamans]
MDLKVSTTQKAGYSLSGHNFTGRHLSELMCELVSIIVVLQALWSQAPYNALRIRKPKAGNLIEERNNVLNLISNSLGPWCNRQHSILFMHLSLNAACICNRQAQHQPPALIYTNHWCWRKEKNSNQQYCESHHSTHQVLEDFSAHETCSNIAMILTLYYAYRRTLASTYS